MTDEGKRYVDLAAALKALSAGVPRYDEVMGKMDRIWWRLSELEQQEIDGLLIALDEVERTGMGYPPANSAADLDADPAVDSESADP